MAITALDLNQRNLKLHAAAIESLGINGVGLARAKNAIGIRGIVMLPQFGLFDGKLPLVTLNELGAFDPDLRYNHISFRVPVTQKAINQFLKTEHFDQNTPFWFEFQDKEATTIHLYWSFDGAVISGKFESTLPVKLLLLANGCHGPAEVRSITDSTSTLIQGDLRVTASFGGKFLKSETASTLDRLEAKLRDVKLSKNDKPRMAGHIFSISADNPVYFTLAEKEKPVVPANIKTVLAEGMRNMASCLPESSGAAQGCADAIQRLVGYGASYDTAIEYRFVAVNRTWAGPNSCPPAFMWDNFFTSYMACLFNPKLGKESLGHILEIIRKDGIIGAPPQRNLIVPVVYSKIVRFMGDRGFAQESFPVMMEFMRFWFADRGDGHPWRDGNDDGLIECGSCLKPDNFALNTIVQYAFNETGYDDSPMYSDGFGYKHGAVVTDGIKFDFDRGTLNLTMVGQNSLYVAACKSMAVVAKWLGQSQDYKWLLDEAERVSQRMRERLYSKELGYFQNRFFNGHFSTVKTMTIFYPLLAGLADKKTTKRLKEILLDPGQFWGQNIIPTVSRDDPACRGDHWLDSCWQGNYWRGNVWPPTNYIIYLAIRNAGWAEITHEFSVMSRKLFMADWVKKHHAMENYPPEGRTDGGKLWFGGGGREPHYIWAGLLPLISLEQLFSVEDVKDGIRLGTINPKSFGTWSNFFYHGKKSLITVHSSGVRLEIADELSFAADAPIAIREFIVTKDLVRFIYDAKDDIKIKIKLSGRTIEKTLPAGSEIEFTHN